MSMYNAIFGVNGAAPFLLAMLGTSAKEVPRFRDCFYEDGHIVIYTRTGGGNRDDYEEGNDRLRGLPGFIGDDDDDFDSTYAYWRYEPNEQFRPLLVAMGNDKTPRERWDELFAALRDGNK